MGRTLAHNKAGSDAPLPRRSKINGWRRLVHRIVLATSWRKLVRHVRVTAMMWSYSLGSQEWERWFSNEGVCGEGQEVSTHRDFLFDMLRVLVYLPLLHSDVSSRCNSDGRLLSGSTTTKARAREPQSRDDTWWWVSSAAGDSTSDLVGSLLYDVVSLGEGVASLDSNKNHHPVRDALEEVPLHTLQGCLGSLFRRLVLLASSFLKTGGQESVPTSAQSRVVTGVRIGTVVLELLTSFPKLLSGFWEEFHVEVEHILKPTSFRAAIVHGTSETVLGARMVDIIEEIIVECFPPLQ